MNKGKRMRIQRGLACFVAAVLLGLGAPAFAQTGHQLFLGPAYEGPPPAAVPFAPAEFDIDTGRLALTVYLNRAPDAGTEHPTAISFDVVWNPSVLTIASPAAVTPVPLLNDWYGKQTTVGFGEVEDGVLVISIAGGVTFPPNSFDTLSTEITTFDNQLPEIAPEQGAPQQNSFPLATIEFVIASPPGNSTAIGLDADIAHGQLLRRMNDNPSTFCAIGAPSSAVQAALRVPDHVLAALSI